MKITLVIPTYNEVENLPRLVAAILAQSIAGLEILIVDDTSPDGTGAVADALAAQHANVEVLHRKGPRGLGRAYIYGFEHALQRGAEAIGQMDCDFSHPPEKLPELVAKLAECDLALGSRYIPGGSIDRHWPLWRKALSRWGNFYARSILGIPVKDVTGAFRLWRRELLEMIPYQNVVSSGYVFLYEILFLAHRAGARFGEVPFYFADRTEGKSKMRMRVQIEAAVRVWQVRWHYRNWRPPA